MGPSDRGVSLGWGALLIVIGLGMLAAAVFAADGVLPAIVTAVAGFAFMGAGFAAIRAGKATRKHAEFVIVTVGIYLVVLYLV